MHKCKTDDEKLFSYFKTGAQKMICRNYEFCIQSNITIDISKLNSQMWISTTIVISTFLESS